MVTITSIAGGAPKPVFDRLGPTFEQRTGHKLNALYDTMSGIAAAWRRTRRSTCC